MILKSLKLKNFQLFQDVEIIFDKVNIIKGINLDSDNQSSNGSGKSTIGKNALTFVLYGDVLGKHLSNLIHFGAKSTTAEIEIKNGKDTIHCIRKQPSELKISYNDKEIEGNTNSIKQQWIDEHFGSYDYFKKYRLIDLKGTNLLDYCADSRSVVTLKKELMNFVDDLFTGIRQTLLDAKLEREKFSSDKRPYSFYLSTKRKCLLDSGLIKIVDNCKEGQKLWTEQQEEVNKLKIEIKKNETEIYLLKETQSTNGKNIENYTQMIDSYQAEVYKLNNKVKETIEIIDYDSLIKETESKLEEFNNNNEFIGEVLDEINKEIPLLEALINQIESDMRHEKTEQKRINLEIENLESSVIGAKCDKCGALVTEEHKEIYRKEKNTKLIASTIIETNLINMLKSPQTEIVQKQNEVNNWKAKKNDVEREMLNLNSHLRVLNTDKSKQSDEIKVLDKAEYNKLAEIQNYSGKIDAKKIRIEELNQEIQQSYHKIEQLVMINKELEDKLLTESNHLTEISKANDILSIKKDKIESLIMKLNEAFKFADYKYTPKDVMLYTESIKVLDDFSGYYINEWLGQLSLIMNDLMKGVNLKVDFSPEKEFIKIMDSGRYIPYELLSDGQKTFLGGIFRIAILIHKGDNSGLIIADEGLGSMDEANFKDFIEVCKNTNFQFFVIYQDAPEIDEVNYIDIERKDGESKVK